MNYIDLNLISQPFREMVKKEEIIDGLVYKVTRSGSEYIKKKFLAVTVDPTRLSSYRINHITFLCYELDQFYNNYSILLLSHI